MVAAVASSESELQARLRRSILREWTLSTAALLILTFCLSYFSDAVGLRNLDNTLYDQFISALAYHPPSPDIVIVAIDDGSIEELGYWPWRRAKHAALLKQLADARAVALDLVLSEHNPAYPDDDAILADAIRTHGRVILPSVVGPDNQTLLQPLPILADAAARTGFINIYADTDGVIRSFSPQKRLNDGHVLNHLSLDLLEVGHEHHAGQRLREHGLTRLRIPYTRFAGEFTIVPYSRVLDGSISAPAFRNKFVLVGSWGSGLGDTYATPYSKTGDTMSGVEVLANLLNGGLTDRWINTPGRLSMALLCLIPVLLSCLTYRHLSPQRAFICSVAIFASTFVVVALLLHYTFWWLAPSAALVGSVLAYPVWSWRSQHAALRHIDGELALLRTERLASVSPDVQDPALPATQAAPQRDQSLLARIKQLHYAIDSMRVAQRQRNETLRFLSHDMRSPLNSILALTELQRNSDQHASTDKKMLAQFDHYAQKTLALVDGFVALGRAEAMDLSLQPTDLAELIQQCCEDMWVRAQQKQIRIQVDDLPTPAWVSADASLLERAWANLLDNAVKYSPDDTTIICTLKLDGDDWVAGIQDQGRGMDTEKLASAFTPFIRIDEHQSQNPAGAGLGLAFVHTVITRHNGQISVQSQPGVGTCFSIRLPALEHQDQATPATQ